MLIKQPLRILEENTDTESELLSYIGPFLLTAIVSMLLLSQILNMAASITGGVSLSTMGTGAWTSRKIAAPFRRMGSWSWKKIANRSGGSSRTAEGRESWVIPYKKRKRFSDAQKDGYRRADPYFKAAQTWEQEIIANAIQSRNRAWILLVLLHGFGCFVVCRAPTAAAP